jgi:serine/threonine protein kinase
MGNSLSVDHIQVISHRIHVALAGSHEENWVHRNLTPDNIFLRESEANGPQRV